MGNFIISEKSDQEHNKKLHTKIKDQFSTLVKTITFSSMLLTSVAQANMNESAKTLDLQKYNSVIDYVKQNSINNHDKTLTNEELLQDLSNVNKSVNTYTYMSDSKLYGQKDFYASPVDMIRKKAGDCEDFAMMKFHILVNELGYDPNKFKFVYGQYKDREAHMILTYEFSKDKHIALDNTNNTLYLMEKGKDFKPTFFINNDNTYTSGGKTMSLKENSKYSSLFNKTKLENIEKELNNYYEQELG